MKKIVVCSKNKAKNMAVEKVIKDFIKDYYIVSLETNSNVSETPISDDEGIKGCLNRIDSALKQDDGGYLYIAMEGILTETMNESFLCGWTVIFNNETKEYLYGCSAKVHIPKEIMKDMDSNKRLSDVVSEYKKTDEDMVRNYGTNGILTNGCYTRTDEFMDSILCAISSKFIKNN